MANTGRAIATLFIGAAVGAAVGYILATDEQKRKENMDMIKDKFQDLKDKVSRKKHEVEEDIYNA